MNAAFERLAARLPVASEALLVDMDRTPRGERSAAVLLLLSDTPDPEMTFVTRAEGMRRHAGQIALPGGAVDPEDLTLQATALREAHEEIGLRPDEVTVLGELPALWVPASRYDVTAVIGLWAGERCLSPMDPAETGAVHSIPVSTLASPDTRVMGRHPAGFVGPAFMVDDGFIWGLTGYLVNWVLDLAGWALHWDAGRIVDVPERFLRD